MIQRITMFKVHKDEDVESVLAEYGPMEANAQKDGKPYIRECVASQSIDVKRSHGYKVVAMTKFDSLDDMKYYDEQCEAHQTLKKNIHGKVEVPPLTFYAEI